MNRAALTITAAAGGFLAAGGAAFADCPTGSYSISTLGNSYSVFFDQMLATQATPAVCNNFTVPTAVGPGVVAVYSAEYRGGFDDPDGTGRLTVTHNGVTNSSSDIGDPLSPGDLYYSHLIGSDSNGDIKSSIELELLQSADPGDQVELATLDYNELAHANISDLQTSIDQLSADHTALVTHLGATADLLTGAGQRFDQPDGVTVLGGVGSFTAGVMGRRSLDDGFALTGGVAIFDQSAGGASATGLLASGSLRYVTPGSGFVRPYGEAGLIAAPVMALDFARSYVTSTGTTTTSGTGSGSLFGGFVRGGVVIDPDANNEIVLSGTLAKDWLLSGDYAETLDPSNLFAASAMAQSSSFDIAKLGVDWTIGIAAQTELTLSGAIGGNFAETPVAADVAFAGPFDGAPVSEMFAEYGARVSYEISPSQTVSGFIHGSTGEVSGTHAQIGGDFHVNF